MTDFSPYETFNRKPFIGYLYIEWRMSYQLKKVEGDHKWTFKTSKSKWTWQIYGKTKRKALSDFHKILYKKRYRKSETTKSKNRLKKIPYNFTGLNTDQYTRFSNNHQIIFKKKKKLCCFFIKFFSSQIFPACLT